MKKPAKSEATRAAGAKRKRPATYNSARMVLRLADYLRDSRRGYTMAEIKEHMEIPERTAHRYVGVLREVYGSELHAEHLGHNRYRYRIIPTETA